MDVDLFAHQYDLRENDHIPLFEGHLLAMVLAGGKGERLHPLTEHRAKPAVPFGGTCRLIDFVLSNMVNSGIRQIYVLTQYKAHSLLHHLQQGWAITHPMNGYHLMPVPAQMRGRETWYLGTADAVYQNAHLIKKARPDLILVFGSDHVYWMDVRHMVRYHLEREAEVTVATIPLPLTQCSQFGTAVIDDWWRIQHFEEKTPVPMPIPTRPDQALVSMGNYIFSTEALLAELEDDAYDSNSGHDFGRDILPKLCERRRVYAYDFRTNVLPQTEHPTDYWRDVGTIESYYRASMDLNDPLCHLNLDNQKWPLRSIKYHDLPTRVKANLHGKRGSVESSVIGASTVISGGHVRNSVIGPRVFIANGAVVEESVITGDTVIGEGARIHKAIIDHGNVIEPDERIGYDIDHDASRYYVDQSGVVVVPHHYLH